ncbi:MAG: hypothetical protein KDE23_13170, partial [Caldilinea sp.]|nr:hypothetical protein [Caldilinea sp.]
APATEATAVRPVFRSPVYFPITPWTVNYFDVLADPANGETRLMLTPAQFRSQGVDANVGTLRRFDDMDFRLYYSTVLSATALSAPPAIATVSAETDGGSNLQFRVSASDPVAGIQDVWITYATENGSTWQSLSLSQSASEPSLWQGTLALTSVPAGAVRYMVQAANGVGLVTMLTNNGAFFTPGVDPGAPVAPPLATEPVFAQPAQIGLVSPPTSGVYGGAVTYAARLTSGGSPIANAAVAFTLQDQTVTAQTASDGTASATFRLLGTAGEAAIQVSYAGTPNYLGAGVTHPLTITKQGTQLALAIPPGPVASGAPYAVTATLTDDAGRAIANRTVLLTFTGSGGTVARAVSTDFVGRATVRDLALPAGSYSVDARFGTATTVGGAALDLTDPGYQSATASGALTIAAGNAPPQATDDSAGVVAGRVVAIDVAANDVDADGNLNPSAVSIVQAPAGGVATVDATSGRVRYAASFAFTGIDRFTYRICDTGGLCAVAAVAVTVLPGPNGAPQVGSITFDDTVTIFPLGTPVSARALFTDTDAGDSHAVLWDWGDGSTTAGTVSGDPLAGAMAGPDSHLYAEPGVYTVVLTVTDGSQAAATSTYQYVVIYDPTAGVASGDGWINSPLGAYTPNPALAVRAKFGFEVKYRRNDTVPTGNLRFRLDRIRFEVSTFDWLVISGPKAIVQGVGEIDGHGRYGFMLTALHEGTLAPKDNGTFRLKVWEINNGNAVVYDNEPGQLDGATPITPVTQGRIKIKTKAGVGSASAVDSLSVPSDWLVVGAPPQALIDRLREDSDVVYTHGLFLPLLTR